MIIRYLSVLLVVTALSGCDYSEVRDETSELYAVPVGSILVLNSAITIPSGAVSVLMQDGKISHSSDIDYYFPNCKFELFSISEKPREVRPDRFLITRVVDENEFTDLQKTLYAGRRMFVDDAPETITYATVLYLESEIQPDVYRTLELALRRSDHPDRPHAMHRDCCSPVCADQSSPPRRPVERYREVSSALLLPPIGGAHPDWQSAVVGRRAVMIESPSTRVRHQTANMI